MTKAWLVCPVVVLAAAGCQSSDSDQTETAARPERVPTSAELASECDKHRFTDNEGRHWIGRTAIVVEEGSLDRDDAVKNRPRPDEMNEEQLAEALRPVARWGDCEYTTVEAPLDLARRAIAMRGVEQDFPGYEGDAPSPAAPPEGTEQDHPEDVDDGSSLRSGVFGADQREIRRDNTSFPMRTQLYLQSTQTTCSATMIGPSTAVTAAHCYHNGSAWKPNMSWSPGADRQDSIDYPYRPGHSYPSSTSGGLQACYIVSVPGGWMGADADWDIAVLEFDISVGGISGCGLRPGNVVGWLGWGWQTDADTEQYNAWIYGYPGSPSVYGGCGDAGGCNGSTDCLTPTIWGWSRGLEADWSYRLNFLHDVTGGQSGSGIYNNKDGTRRVMGVVTGCQINLFGDYNYGRRINSEAIEFIRANSQR